MTDAGDDRVRVMMGVVPVEWDKGPLVLAHEIREFLKTIVDHGSGIDSGGGDGMADLHPVIGGIEYHISIKTSRKVS